MFTYTNMHTHVHTHMHPQAPLAAKESEAADKLRCLTSQLDAGSIQDLDDPSFGTAVSHCALPISLGAPSVVPAPPYLPVEAGGLVLDLGEALRSACEAQDADRLNSLLAHASNHDSPDAVILPLPEMTVKSPWDGLIIDGQKTVEGRVAHWNRNGKWKANRKLDGIKAGAWYVMWSKHTHFVVHVDEYHEVPTFGDGWVQFGDALVPPAAAEAALGRSIADARDVDALYQRFYPKTPLFADDGTSNIVAAMLKISVVAVVYDTRPLPPSQLDSEAQVSMRLRTCTHTHAHAHARAYAHVHVHEHVDIYMYIEMDTHMCMHVFMCMARTCTCAYACAHPRSSTPRRRCA